MQADRSEIIEQHMLADELEKRRCEKSYYYFYKAAWEVLEPQTPFKDNWHYAYICNILQKEIERIAARQPKTKDLIINIPPRSGKSYLVSIMLTAWAWINYPHLKFINSSHSKELSTEHCVKTRRLIDSDWYQDHWKIKFMFEADQNQKTYYENDKKGARVTASVTGGVTGKGGDVLIADDLLDAKNADSKLYRQSANDHFNDVLFTRLNDQDIGLRIVIMQRLHPEDLTGDIIETKKDDYNYISIPAELNGTKDEVHPIDLKKHYTNNLFFPLRFTRKFLDAALKSLRPRKYAGQYLQAPAPPEGNLFKRSDWQFYDELPKKLDEIIQSWDFSFKGGVKNDYVVGQVWGRKGADCYLIDQIRRRMGFEASKKALLQMTKNHPHAITKLIEDKANGSAIIDSLKRSVAGLKEVEPKGNKLERAELVYGIIESGNVFLPNPKHKSWVDGLIEECATFTGKDGDTDDQVDALTQALNRLGVKNAVADLEKLLEG